MWNTDLFEFGIELVILAIVFERADLGHLVHKCIGVEGMDHPVLRAHVCGCGCVGGVGGRVRACAFVCVRVRACAFVCVRVRACACACACWNAWMLYVEICN
jgi:hypothetical protein